MNQCLTIVIFYINDVNQNFISYIYCITSFVINKYQTTIRPTDKACTTEILQKMRQRKPIYTKNQKLQKHPNLIHWQKFQKLLNMLNEVFDLVRKSRRGYKATARFHNLLISPFQQKSGRLK